MTAVMLRESIRGGGGGDLVSKKIIQNPSNGILFQIARLTGYDFSRWLGQIGLKCCNLPTVSPEINLAECIGLGMHRARMTNVCFSLDHGSDYKKQH